MQNNYKLFCSLLACICLMNFPMPSKAELLSQSGLEKANGQSETQHTQKHDNSADTGDEDVEISQSDLPSTFKKVPTKPLLKGWRTPLDSCWFLHLGCSYP